VQSWRTAGDVVLFSPRLRVSIAPPAAPIATATVGQFVGLIAWAVEWQATALRCA